MSRYIRRNGKRWSYILQLSILQNDLLLPLIDICLLGQKQKMYLGYVQCKLKFGSAVFYIEDHWQSNLNFHIYFCLLFYFCFWFINKLNKCVLCYSFQLYVVLGKYTLFNFFMIHQLIHRTIELQKKLDQPEAQVLMKHRSDFCHPTRKLIFLIHVLIPKATSTGLNWLLAIFKEKVQCVTIFTDI